MVTVLSALWLVWAAPLFDSLNYGQPSAVLWKDQLFVAIAAKSTKASAKLYRGPFTLEARRVRSPVEHNYLCYGVAELTQAKIDLRNDRMLLLETSGDHSIYPLADIPFFEDSEFGAKLRALREPGPPEADPRLESDPDRIKLRDYARFTRICSPYAGPAWRLLLPKHRESDIELSGAPDDIGDKPSKSNYLNAARHDVLLAGPRSVRLFHAYKDRFFVSVEPDYLNNWYYDAQGEVAKNLPPPPNRGLRTGKLPADFTERFAAYTSAKRDYLVTTTGKVYLLAPKGKAEVEVSAVWNDPKQKIVGVVQDQANDMVYGWGFITDSRAPERFYVKLDPKPMAVPYKRTVPLWNDRSDAYLESYECARAVRAANEKK